MTHHAEDIYHLLPAIYRIRDQERGGPLQALVTLLAEQAGVVEADIARLHENWFIETCEEWVVPYLGDLLGVRGLHPVGPATFSLRARVANTLAYRRRKGTATMLEQLARDTTGWPARAVEFFELLVTTQHYNHLRAHSLATPDVRRTDVLELLDTPFDGIAHTADVRSIASRRGRYNIPNVGLFLWRWQHYPLQGVTARALVEPSDGRYTFHPLGLDAPLCNAPQPEREITHLAEERNVPGELRRRALYDELEARRQALTDAQEFAPLYFGEAAVLEIFINGAAAVRPEEILICDLSAWPLPDATKTYQRTDGTSVAQPIRVAVDPRLGRMTFPTTETPGEVLVGYAYGFSGDVGGGPYSRRDAVEAVGKDRTITWQVGVSKTLAPVPDKIFSTLAAAVDAWNLQPAGGVGRIAILDNRTYPENLTGAHQIKVPEGSQLMIFAASLAPGQPMEAAVPQQARPHLHGNLSVAGTAPTKSQTPGELILNGLLLEGDVKVLTGHLGSLRVDHCTIVPTRGGLSVNGGNAELIVRLERSICGGIELPESVQQLRVNESIVDGAGGKSVQAPGAQADLQASTFFGAVEARMIEAGNAIFTEKVTAILRQAGCVRFCFLPENSVTPRRYRCQPELALQDVSDPAAQQQIRARVQPAFTAATYGPPGYAQLRLTVPVEIRAGADDGAEMGVFRFLRQPQREANLRASLDEYLRFGLEAGIFYAT